MYDKNLAAEFPPMGWNSYDYYNVSVNEAQIRANAYYMAKNLKQSGYEYIVVDIQWSDPDAGRDVKKYQYIPFQKFCVDEYSRQIPAPSRFPSSANNSGFAPLAEYIHSLGLKFGIHIMRGIPRFCCHEHRKILTHDGAFVTADQIANPYSISKWNPDMYGLNTDSKYAQDYYDSLFELYASWKVDFVKVDDICNTNMYPHEPYSAEKEIELIYNAIKNCGRPMVLSLSPGPAIVEKAFHLKRYANMWRITDDFWDSWDLLKNMFYRCELWQTHSEAGSWPDCDMLPVGIIGHGFEDERKSRFSFDEQKTMLTLWCIFRSPLMIGSDLPLLDSKTLKLLTNKDILSLLKLKTQARLVFKSEEKQIWVNGNYIAIFNISDKKIHTDFSDISAILEKNNISESAVIYDMWKQKESGIASSFSMELNRHCTICLKLL